MYSFLSLVSTNRSNYARRELDRIDAAKKLYINSGMSGSKKFFKSLENNLIRDCPLPVDDAKRCLSVYGKEIAKLKGSKTRKKSSKIGKMVMILFLTSVHTSVVPDNSMRDTVPNKILCYCAQ